MKGRHFSSCIMALTFIILLFNSAWAQPSSKSTRVYELEDHIRTQVLNLIQSRFPNEPSMVNVSITPLLRTSRGTSSYQSLPYYDLSESELPDEWSDPDIPVYGLFKRIQTMTISVKLPDTISEDHIKDLESSIRSATPFIAGRDRLDIDSENWVLTPPLFTSSDYKWFGALGVSLLFLCLTFLWGFRTLKNGIKTTSSDGGQPARGAAPAALPMSKSSAGGEGIGRHLGQDLRFNDSLKIKAHVRGVARELANIAEFPTLDDLVQLENLGEEDPQALGALLVEFDHPTREKLLSFTRSDIWLNALYRPGELNPSAVKVIEQIAGKGYRDVDVHTEETLIRLWNLESSKAESLLATLDRKFAFALLVRFPKKVAIPLGRSAFPGAWGVILEADLKDYPIEKSSRDDLLKKLKDISPDRNLGAFEQFTKDKELLQYVRYVNVQEEKDIYTAASTDSLLYAMRPPFFQVFDFDESVIEQVVQQTSIDQLALACFNVDRDMRKQLEVPMSEKERFLLIQYLKDFDRNRPDPEDIASAREHIALLADSLHKDIDIDPTSEENDSHEISAA